MATISIIIIFISGLIVGLIVIKWELARKKWPTTTAYVSSAEIIPDYGKTRGVNPQVAVLTNMAGLAYNIELSYEFKVRQKKYYGKSINLKNDKRISKEIAEERVKSIYQPGLKIQIYYNPKRPNVSMLERASVVWGIQIIAWTVTIVILLFIFHFYMTGSYTDITRIFK